MHLHSFLCILGVLNRTEGYKTGFFFPASFLQCKGRGELQLCNQKNSKLFWGFFLLFKVVFLQECIRSSRGDNTQQLCGLVTTAQILQHSQQEDFLKSEIFVSILESLCNSSFLLVGAVQALSDGQQGMLREDGHVPGGHFPVYLLQFVET